MVGNIADEAPAVKPLTWPCTIWTIVQSSLPKYDKIIHGFSGRNEVELARGYHYRPLIIDS
jgi:hypothetical protein